MSWPGEGEKGSDGCFGQGKGEALAGFGVKRENPKNGRGGGWLR